VTFCLGCGIINTAPARTSGKNIPGTSLQADRAHLEKLREDIPAELQATNDQQAYILSFFSNRNRNPNTIRNNFQKDMVKKRNQLNKYLRKQRDSFNKENRHKQDTFLKNLKEKRKDFSDSKPSKDKRKDFYDMQDQQRKDFFANQKDIKKEFGEIQKMQRSDFSQNSRDLRKAFNEELKLYRLEYKQVAEKKKQQATLRRKATRSSPRHLKNNINDFSPEVQSIILDLDKMYKQSAEPL